MNLKLVTFNLDYTQFLVDSNITSKAIDLAVEANQSELCGPLAQTSDYGLTIEETEDITNYTVEDVDMKMLGNICKRDDYVGNYNGVLIFNG